VSIPVAEADCAAFICRLILIPVAQTRRMDADGPQDLRREMGHGFGPSPDRDAGRKETTDARVPERS
jgi:hypothetical protein